jgi:hypothetical protein
VQRQRVRIVVVVFCALLMTQCGARPPQRVAFWFEDGALAFPAAVTERLGGALSAAEEQSLVRVARAELEAAFSGLRLEIRDGRDGFWRVAVNTAAPDQGVLPNAGVALPLGPFGGFGVVSTSVVSFEAVRYAPASASRETILEGIGRGIGRVAAHEVAHQILGPGAPHNETDESSYEYHSPARAAQYYGTLHWTIWWPALERKLGA